MQNVHFSTTDLAELFSVNVSTIKRWIDRGMLLSDTTPGGHRRVTQRHLEAFVENNKRLAEHPYVLRRYVQKSVDSGIIWRQLYKKLLANDIGACRSLIQDAFLSKAQLPHLLENVITPALKHIGSEWAKGRISIYQEHQMSFLVRLLLVEMNTYIPEPSKHAKKAILACIEGDRHEIPLQMLGLILKMHSIKPVILGTNIPVSEIIRACESAQPQFLLLTRVFSKLRTFNYLQTVARYASMHNIRMVYGGQGWSEKEKKSFVDSGAMYDSSLISFDGYLQKTIV